MHLLFITYEYLAQPFSGNGLYAASQVRGLRSLGQQVTVLAGSPDCAHDEVSNISDTIWVRPSACLASATSTKLCTARKSRATRRNVHAEVCLHTDRVASRKVGYTGRGRGLGCVCFGMRITRPDTAVAARAV